MRELEIGMSKRYCCAKCGAELKKNDYVVNLAPVFFMGMDEQYRTVPVYVSEKELICLLKEGIVNEDGYTELKITPEKFLSYAYGEGNREYLEGNKTSFEQALESLEIKLGLRSAEEEPIEEEIDEKDDEEEGYNPFGSNSASRKTTGVDSPEGDPCIPGFTEAMSAQVVANFAKGSMDVRLKRDGEYGIKFSNLSYSGKDKNGAGDGSRCPYCKGKILKGAHHKPQLLVGVVGFQKVGKSCLIAALCDLLLKNQSASPELAMPEKTWEEAYKKELEKYRRGCTVDKTAEDGTNTYNPSVITNHAIWTFVDVPGEAIQDPESGKFNILAVENRFKSITRCDAYIFCASFGAISKESNYGEMTSVFASLLNNVENKGRPVLFVLTQEDEKITDDMSIKPLAEDGALKNCVHASYIYYKETKFVLEKHDRLQGILGVLAANNYLTAITCSAYGHEPIPAGKFKLEMDKSPEAKNIDTIVEWIQRLYGMTEVSARQKDEGDEILKDGHTLQRNDNCRSERECEYIARMFAKPSDLDRRYIDATAKGFLGKIELIGLNVSSMLGRKREAQ